jgi:hypothetical protein
VRTPVALAVGVVVGLFLSPDPLAAHFTSVEYVPVLVAEPAEVGATCQQALQVERWQGDLEPDEIRADCTIALLGLLGWDVNVRTIGVANDYADVMYGGPCAGLERLREDGSW